MIIFHEKNFDKFTKTIIFMMNKAYAKSKGGCIDFLVNRIGEYIFKIIDNHNTPSFILILKCNNSNLLLKIECEHPPLTTLREINWYRRFAKNVLTPRIFAFIIKNNIAVIVMDYLESSDTIDELIINNNLPYINAYKLIQDNINQLTILFEANKRKFSELKCRDKFFTYKFYSKIMNSYCSQKLRSIFDINPIIINDKEYKNILQCLSAVISDSKLHKYITPEYHGYIHGDLHCGNILIDSNDNSKYYWIDPKADELMPIEYDYGKLLHSLHGAYDLIIRN